MNTTLDDESRGGGCPAHRSVVSTGHGGMAADTHFGDPTTTCKGSAEPLARSHEPRARVASQTDPGSPERKRSPTAKAVVARDCHGSSLLWWLLPPNCVDPIVKIYGPGASEKADL